MDLTLPPIEEPIAGPAGKLNERWFSKLQLLLRRANGRDPVPLPSFVVTALPDATRFAGCTIYVSNEAGGAQPATSDGASWRRHTDRAIVS